MLKKLLKSHEHAAPNPGRTAPPAPASGEKPPAAPTDSFAGPKQPSTPPPTATQPVPGAAPAAGSKPVAPAAPPRAPAPAAAPASANKPAAPTGAGPAAGNKPVAAAGVAPPPAPPAVQQSADTPYLAAEGYPILPEAPGPLPADPARGESDAQARLFHKMQFAGNRALIDYPKGLTASTVQIASRCLELGLPVNVASIDQVVAKLPLTGESIAAAGRLAAALGVPPERVQFHGAPLTAWRLAKPTYAHFAGLTATRARLDALPGLAAAKETIGVLLKRAQYEVAQKHLGAEAHVPSLNLEISGKPGTGKSTVARLYAEMLMAAGATRRSDRGALVLADRAALVGRVTGETAQKTLQLLERARGGVLWIDDAHTLNTGVTDGFGQEAVGVIKKYVEDHRDDITLILSGDESGMRQLYNANPGFKSRVTEQAVLAPLTEREFAQALLYQAQTQGCVLAPETQAYIENHAASLHHSDEPHGLLARTLVEQAQNRSITRATRGILTATRPVLLPEDFAAAKPSVREGASALVRLSRLPGQEDAKLALRTSLAGLRAARLRQSRGLAVRARAPAHALIVGAPGSGRGTLAQLYAEGVRESSAHGDGATAPVSGAGFAAARLGDKVLPGSIVVVDELQANAETVTRLRALVNEPNVVLAASCTPQTAAYLDAQAPDVSAALGLRVVLGPYSEADVEAVLAHMLAEDGFHLASGLTPGAVLERGRARGEQLDTPHKVRAFLDVAQERLDVRIGEGPSDDLSDAALVELSSDDFEAENFT